MKKISVLCFALALVLSACSNDDDNNNTEDTSGDLIGTWIGQDIDYTGSTVTSALGQDITSTFVGEAYDIDYTLTFSENPNEVVSDGNYNIELTTTVLGQTQTETIENLEFLNTGTWIRSGNELTIVSDEGTTEATIVELSGNTLVLAVSENQESSEQGFEISTSVDFIATYTKM